MQVCAFGSRFVLAAQPTLTITADSFAVTYGDATPNLANAYTMYEFNQAERPPPPAPTVFAAAAPVPGVGLSGLGAFLGNLSALLSGLVVITPEPSDGAAEPR